MLTPANAVTTYILAKDGNRPFLMRKAFAENAELEMVVKTDAISFPSSARGVASLEDILVRRFGVDYENIFTFCLAEPPATECVNFSCHWLVGMSGKGNGPVRIGCGRYDWRFGSQGRVEKLIITIDVMKVLPPDSLSPAMVWLSALSYPWCSADEALQRIPALDLLAEIRSYLLQIPPILPAP
ncbi:hypothetical protein Q3C01_40915 [Bradyrhizobium sp. UFLA05-109]